MDLALVWLQMGIHEFAGTHKVVSLGNRVERKDRIILVIALEFLRFVGAVGLWIILKWAVVQSIRLGSYIVVERMLSGSIVKLCTRAAN